MWPRCWQWWHTFITELREISPREGCTLFSTRHKQPVLRPHILRHCCIAAIIVAMEAGSRADTPIAGTAPSSLPLSGSPYLITANLTVAAGSTLSIEAGTVLKFQDRTALLVSGSLSAAGTASAPIVFTSASSSTPGVWCGIGVQQGGSANLQHIAVRFAGLPGGFSIPGQLPHAAALFAYHGSLSVSDSELSASGGDGVYYLNDSQQTQTLSAARNTISGCSGDGVRIDAVNAGDSVTISANTINTNGGFAVRVTAGAVGMIAADNVTMSNTLGDSTAVSTGSISGTVTLPVERTWIVLGQITIPSGAILNVSAGDTLRFRGGVRLQVAGILNVNGTPGSQASLIADASPPTAATRWAGMGLQQGAAASLANAIVSGAGYANSFQVPGVSGYHTASIFCYRASLLLSSVAIASGGGDALYWFNDSGARTLSVSNGSVTASGNDGYVVASDTAADSITISGNTVTSVQRYPVVIPARRLAGLSGNNITANGNPAVVISGGSIDRDAALAAGGLYLALQPLMIKTGATLSAEAGATVRFASGSYLDVFGTLNTQGTAAMPVTFTSFFPNPLPGDWGGVDCEPGATARLNYTTIRFAGQDGAFLVAGVGGVDAAVLVNRASVTATGLVCDSSSAFGLYAFNSGSPAQGLSLSNSTFIGNQSDGLHIHMTVSGDAVTIANCGASFNAGDGVRVMSAAAPVNIANLTANSNGGFPVHTVADLLGEITAPSFSGNTAGDQVALEGGSILGDVTSTFPVRLLQYVDIPIGSAFRLVPGADVTCSPLSWLSVEGTLTCAGTPTAPLSLHGPPGASAGAWGGIAVYEGGTASIDNAVLDSAGEPGDFDVPLYPNVNTAVLVYRGTLSLTNAVISNSGGDGVSTINDGNAPRSVSVSSVTVSHAVGTGLNIIAARADDPLAIGSNIVTACGGPAVSMPMRSLYAYGAGNTFSANAGGDGVRLTAVSLDTGTLSKNTSIEPGATLLPAQTVSVAPGTTLNLGAGVTVRMAGGASFLVSGILATSGLPASPVLFTANSPAPVPGYWGGIGFGAGAVGQLTGLETRFGGASITLPGGLTTTASIAATSAAISLNGSLLRDGAGTLLYLRGSSCALTASNTTLSDNVGSPHARLLDSATGGAVVFGGSTAGGCDFLSVQTTGVSNGGPGSLTARSCYWGAPDGPRPPGSGAGVSGQIDFAPYLTVAANLPVVAIAVSGPSQRGIITLSGTAYSRYLASAQLLVASAGPSPTFSLVSRLPAPVTNGVLGTWDASAVPDGTYILRIVVTDRLGRVNAADTSVTIGTGNPQSGDLNGDGLIDMADALLALRIAAGLFQATAGTLSAGDVRPNLGGHVGDGRISMDDVTAILRKALNPGFPWP